MLSIKQRNYVSFVVVSLIILPTVLINNQTFGVNSTLGRQLKSKSMRKGLLQNHSPIVIGSDNDFKQYNFTGKGTIDKPYLIQNFNITTNEAVAIYVGNTTKYFTIENCYLKAMKMGITLSGVKQQTAIISNNTIVSNSEEGIYILYSLGVRIEFNAIISNGIGILFFFGAKTIVKNNTIANNTMEGIRLEFTDSSLFIYNHFTGNGYYGIFVVQTSDYNQIHHNWFISNYIGHYSQAYDDGKSNMWYVVYTLEGNYWSNWNGTGYYYIAGNAGVADRYPLNVNLKRQKNTTTEKETQLMEYYSLILLPTLAMAAVLIKRKHAKKRRSGF